ncbi:MAG TPA: phosphatase PAP2 family protein [Acetobacteraceae bacterium]
MTIHRRAVFLLAAILAVPILPVRAAEPPYVTATQLDLVPFLPPPDASGSDADRAAQQAVVAAQRATSPDRVALAAADAEESVFAMFASVLGPAFATEALPDATRFFDRVGETEDAVVDPAKKHFNRTRPFMANEAEIKPLVKPSRSGAYPSGHATRVTMAAIILSSMLPEKRAAIWARAEEYAQSRVIGGMHYPQDLEGGKRAGSAIAAMMFTDPDFIGDYALARSEIRRALAL